jgi:hypothetical protein
MKIKQVADSTLARLWFSLDQRKPIEPILDTPSVEQNIEVTNQPLAIDWSLTPARQAFKERILKEYGNHWPTIRLGRRPSGEVK